jgi:hypothetical protein
MSHSYTTNQIQLNVPSKVLPVSVNSIEGTEYWPFANSSSDPWYSGSGSPRYYRWRITFSVTAVTHGSNLTRDDFTFNGLDIRVNDWIAGASDPKSLKIISIEAKTATSVTCIVEDWLRYNTFKASTGNGIFNTGSAVVFTLNENGMPMLDPLPSTVNAEFFPTVYNRFQYLNPQLNFVLEQEAHSFSKGDAIAVTGSGFVKANADTAAKMVGVVTETGPGPDYFMVSPNNRIIDFDPGIPGVQGDSIYVDTNGTLSNVSTATNKIIFLNLTGPTPTSLTGSVGNPVVPANTNITVNKVDITVGGSLANVTNQLNAETANTLVVASQPAKPTVITSNATGTAYGLIGGFVPFSATINGTLVNFTTDTAGQAAYSQAVAIPEDMATDINAASITNLEASFTNTDLILTETAGGSITIINGTNDVNNNPFVGASNVSGLPATTAPSGQQLLRLSRSDGGEVLILDTSLQFQSSTGIYSGQNGSLPLALNVEQGVRTGGTTVVADISARDALTALVGDQSYVVDAGFGEWALYLYDGSSWTQVATQDSSTVDARTLTTSFSGAYSGNIDVQALGSISPGRKITTISIDVDIPLTGGTANPTIEIGTVADPDLFMAPIDSDLTKVEEFIMLPEYIHPSGSGTELSIQARLNHYNATQGQVTVKVTYL